MRRVFVDRIANGEAVARGSVARHLSSVARLRPGEPVEVSDQRRAYRATVGRCSRGEVRFRIESVLPDPPPLPRVEAAVSIVRFRRFEWAVEKLTELGVASIIPVVAARSAAGLVSAAAGRLARWRRIAFEASQQSRRLAAPIVQPPSGLETVMREGHAGRRVLLDPEGEPALALGGGPVRFLVGPEGGWTPEEGRLAAKHGFEPASVGAGILRTETAAVAMAALCAGRHGEEEHRASG